MEPQAKWLDSVQDQLRIFLTLLLRLLKEQLIGQSQHGPSFMRTRARRELDLCTIWQQTSSLPTLSTLKLLSDPKICKLLLLTQQLAKTTSRATWVSPPPMGITGPPPLLKVIIFAMVLMLLMYACISLTMLTTNRSLRVLPTGLLLTPMMSLMMHGVPILTRLLEMPSHLLSALQFSA